MLRWTSVISNHISFCLKTQEVSCFADRISAQNKHITQIKKKKIVVSPFPRLQISQAECSRSVLRLTQAAAFASLSNQWALLNTGIISLIGLHVVLNSNGAVEVLVMEHYSGMMDSVPRQEGRGKAGLTDGQVDEQNIGHIQICSTHNQQHPWKHGPKCIYKQ